MVKIFLIITLLSFFRPIFSNPGNGQDPGNWTALGPFFPYKRSLRPAGLGWVDAIWADPANWNHLLIGARSGGLWESPDRGNSWKCLTEKIPVYGVFDIDVNPNNPLEILIATGMSGGGYHKFQHHTYGIFKSKNGGKTWIRSNSPRDFTTVSEIERDPFRPNHLFAIYSSHESYWSKTKTINSGNFVLESWDLGSSWLKTTMKGFDGGKIREIKFSPTEKDEVYMSGKGLFKLSIDNGKSWNDLFPDLQGVDSIQKGSRSSTLNRDYILAMDLATFDQKQILYLYAHNPKLGNSLSGNKIFKLKKGQETQMIPHQSSLSVTTKGRVGRPMIRVCPKNENLIFYGKTNLVKLSWNPEELRAEPKLSSRYGGKIHDDLRDLIILDSSFFLVGSDGGFMITEDGGRIWKYKMGDNKRGNEGRINNSEFYDFDVTSFKGKAFIIGGTQDNSSFMYYNGEWVQHGGGDGGVSQILFNNDTSVYFTINMNYYTKLAKMDSFPVVRSKRHFVYASSLYEKVVFPNNSKSEILLIGKVPEKAECQSPSKGSGKGFKNKIHSMSGFIEAFEKNCFTGKNFLELKGYPEEISQGWNAENPYNKWPYNTITSIAQSEIKNDLIAFSTTDWGAVNFRLFITSNKGRIWRNLSGNFPPGVIPEKVHISDILLDPNNKNRMWVCFSHFLENEKVYESNDGGETWENISKGVSAGNVPCNDLEFDKNTGTLYLGNDNGVFYYRTTEEFKEWRKLYDDLPMVRSSHLKVVPELGKLFISTWGRGIWSCPLLPLTEEKFRKKQGRKG
jgi:photosystem II stability/assembly factor-like uncharacterized protein